MKNLKLLNPSNLNKVILVILLTIALTLSGYGKKNSAGPGTVEAAQGNEKDGIQQKVLAFNLEGLSDSGQKKWDVTGKSAESVSQTQMKLNDIVAKSYGNDSEATITARDGMYDKTKNNVTLENDVKATIVSTKSFTGDMVGISTDAKSGVPKEDHKTKKMKTTITCDGEVEFNYENNQAYFSKNVKVSGDDGDIDADKITVNLDPLTRRVKEIIAEGNVKIKQGENMTYSDKAVYVESERKILLTGKPRLVIYQEGGLSGNLFGERK
ncbi:MAG: LPS export ABC transporter periplasmic protein LptC [Candidatus Omnitrophica bacterium]|nr:LPS export ABC transporter periplasmic protein LptC [Candidatus Omnitrophota bacterium]